MSSPDTKFHLQGEILFPQELASFSGATANVFLEDVSFLDASAKLIAKQEIANVSHSQGTETRVKFALQGKIANTQADYSIRVHVTFHSDRQIHLGDYISTQSYRVLNGQDFERVVVEVSEVI